MKVDIQPILTKMKLLNIGKGIVAIASFLLPINVLLCGALLFLCVHKYDNPIYKVPVATESKKFLNTTDGTILAPQMPPAVLKDIPEGMRVKSYIWFTTDGHAVVWLNGAVGDYGESIVWHKNGKWYGIIDPDIDIQRATEGYRYDSCIQDKSCAPITLMDEK
jgi:hypothetical protein